MAEVCAEQGFGSTSVMDVARHAGVSTASFYGQFKDKQECMLASFEELFGRLLGEVERACAAEEKPDAKVRAGLRSVAALLAGDLPATRLLAVEVAAAGLEGVRLQQEAMERLAEALAAAAGSTAVQASSRSEWVAVAAMVALVTKRIAAGKGPEASELEAVTRAAGVSI